jgi:hypothetical protein
MGGATGAIGGGIAGAFPSAATGAVGAGTSVTPTATALAGTGAGTAVTPTATALAGSAAAPSTFGTLSAGTGALPTAATGTFGSLSAGTGALPTTAGTTFGSLAAPTSTGITSLTTPASSALTGTGAASVTPTTTSGANIFGYVPGEKGFISNTGLATIGGTSALGAMMQAERNRFGIPATEDYESTFDPSKFVRSTPTYAPESVYRPEYRDYTTAAEGGIMKLANGGPVERMSMMNTAMNPQGGLYPQGMIDKTQYATPIQRPVSAELVMDAPAYERSNPMLMAEGGIAQILESAKAQGLTLDAYQNIYGRGNAIIEMEKRLKEGKPMTMADGGISSLGGYSDGGRMLKGPGDGMSDSIPGVIGGRQPARLADGEFVVPADVVSHLGNGSTDAGAKQLYSMMDKVRKARTGKKAQGKQINPRKYMPA